MSSFFRPSAAVWAPRSWAGSTQGAGGPSGEMAGRCSGLATAGVWEGCWKRRGLEFPAGACEGAAQVIVGEGVVARKARAAEPNNGVDLGQRRTTAQQLLGDPLVGDAPIGLGEALWNPQPVQPSLVDGGGHRRGEGWIRRAQGGSRASRPRGALGQRQEAVLEPALGGLDQCGAMGGQARLSVEEFHPGSVAVPPPPLGFLVGEAGESSQMTPIGAGRVCSIEAGQFSADWCGYRGLQRRGTDLHPGLQMAGAGLEHDAGLMTTSAHGVDGLSVSVVQIDQDIAGVTAPGEGVQVDIPSLTVASAEKPYRAPVGQQAGRPQPLSRASDSGRVLYESDQIELVRHGRQLTADGLKGDEESAILHPTC